jgi:hypothetical protein
VLLLTFHGGVAASVRWAAEVLHWSLDAPALDDSWIGGCDEAGEGGGEGGGESGHGDSGGRGGGGSEAGGAVHVSGAQPSAAYRFSSRRAVCLWKRNRLEERLAPYDLVIVGDTAPLAWPLLRAGWPERGGGHQRLMLWVCNRFDYGAVGDGEWYKTVRDLASRPAVSVLSSAAFEWKYAQHVRKAPFPSPAVLPPIGMLAASEDAPPDPVPPAVDKRVTYFVLPKVNEARMDLAEALAARGVAVWTPGVWPSRMQGWGGPRAVSAFRAAIHIPYAPVTFALYEHAVTARLLTFVPSAALLLKLHAKRGLFFQSTRTDFVTTGHGTGELTLAMLRSTEWYAPANAPCFVYFDSLEDLIQKLESTDYASRRAELAEWAERHTNSTLRRWQMIDTFLVKGGEEVEASSPPAE